MKKAKKFLSLMLAVLTLLSTVSISVSALRFDYRDEAGVGDYYFEVSSEQPIEIDGVSYYKYTHRTYTSKDSYTSSTVYYAKALGSEEGRKVLETVDGCPVEFLYARYDYPEDLKKDNGYLSDKILPAQEVIVPSTVKRIFLDDAHFYKYTDVDAVEGTLGGDWSNGFYYYTWAPAELRISVNPSNKNYRSTLDYFLYQVDNGDEKLIYVPRGINPRYTALTYPGTSWTVSSKTIGSNAFAFVTDLPQKTILSDSVKRIESYAFFATVSDIVLPKYIEYIGDRAFQCAGAFLRQHKCGYSSDTCPDSWKTVVGWVPHIGSKYILSDTIKEIGSVPFNSQDTVYFLGSKEQLDNARNGNSIGCTVYFNCRVDENWNIVHYDETHDGTCDSCGIDTTADCKHLCHEGRPLNFFYGLCLFFWKLFKTNKNCECGIVHY